MSDVLRVVTEPRHAGSIFTALLFLIHGLLPLGIDAFVESNPHMRSMGLMVIFTCALILLGRHLPIFDHQFDETAWRISIDNRAFTVAVWGMFAVFLVVAFYTAETIPLKSAIFGTLTAAQLEAERGAFLKTREGWQAALPYISAVFAGTLLPYSLARMFVSRTDGRWLAAGLFVFYSISHLQKALIIQVVAPLCYLSARRVIWGLSGLLALIFGTMIVLYFNTVIARGVQDPQVILQHSENRQALAQRISHSEERKLFQNLVPPAFFSAEFRPTSAAEHFIWRMAAVPVFTASDALIVHERAFDSRLLLGATSSFISAVIGLKRINFDAEVHGYQWGDKRVGRSNSVFVTDGYINFGWLGLVIYGLFVGQTFRWVAISSDKIFQAMWPLWAYNIIQASLIGTLLSSGFLLLFLIALFVRFREDPKISRR